MDKYTADLKRPTGMQQPDRTGRDIELAHAPTTVHDTEQPGMEVVQTPDFGPEVVHHQLEQLQQQPHNYHQHHLHHPPQYPKPALSYTKSWEKESSTSPRPATPIATVTEAAAAAGAAARSPYAAPGYLFSPAYPHPSDYGAPASSASSPAGGAPAGGRGFGARAPMYEEEYEGAYDTVLRRQSGMMAGEAVVGGSRGTICGLKTRVFWLVFGASMAVFLIMAVALGVGLGVALGKRSGG